jgi:hypothetical protein
MSTSEIKKIVESALSDGFDKRVAELRKSLTESLVNGVSEAMEAQTEKLREELTAQLTEQLTTQLTEQLTASLTEQLRTQLTGEVRAEVEASLKPAPGAAPTDLLHAAVASVQDHSAQADILRALLDGAEKFAGRAALFIVKGGSANGWEARGFEKDVKKVTLGTDAGLIARALNDRESVAAAAEEFDADFNKKFGNPNDGNCLVLPLVVRDKVPAIVYADAGTADGAMDPSALQLLVRSTGFWLETIALRKSAGAPSEQGEAALAAAAGASAPAAQPTAEAEPEPEPAATPASAAAPAAGDPDLHKKARRFAKLLVDEIKLYNQAKVSEGRQHKDIYDRLKEDIEKSRATYEKRYGQTAAADADYFTQEVVRILADNDRSLMGSSFPQ